MELDDSLLDLVVSLGKELGGRRGRGGPEVRDEIGNGEVGLVPHRGDNGQLRRGNRPGQQLAVKRMEIFKRAASACDHDHVHGTRPG